MPKSADIRLAHLRAYMTTLASDLAAAGKFAAEGENKVEAAVNAVLAGGGAMAVQLATDLRTVGGQGLAMAQPIVEGLLERAAANFARNATHWVGDAVKDMFNGGSPPPSKSEQRRVGMEFMNAAKKMGR